MIYLNLTITASITMLSGWRSFLNVFLVLRDYKYVCGCVISRSEVTGMSASPVAVPQAHRKSNSLDGSERRTKQLVPPIRER